MTLRITDDLDLLLVVLPERIRTSLQELGRASDLIEVVMDLGRMPEARFPDSEVGLSPEETTRDDLQHVIDNIGDFGADNRAGIERTLHRISAIRNRKGIVIGLTCRVGRAVYGVIDIVHDIIMSGSSLLLLGRPGVGKTTLLREASRVLSEKKTGRHRRYQQRDRRRWRHPPPIHRPRPPHAGGNAHPAARSHDRSRRKPHAGSHHHR